MNELVRENITEQEIGQLQSILSDANLPSLLMVLYHFTGDEKWLNEPYRPRRARGMSDNDDGGLPENIQNEIREAAAEVITNWVRGAEIAVPAPSQDKLSQMMAVCAAETEIPENYTRMLGQEMGFVDREPITNFNETPQALRENFKVVIIGAGIGGLFTGLLLKQAGIPFVILEKQSDVGGTWQSHHYPGCGVDTPSYLYSFSFFHRNWSGYFAKQSEVLEYIKDFADAFDMREYIRFGVKVSSARYDEANQVWTVMGHDENGQPETLVANALVSAVGLFGAAKIPDIPGMSDFKGKIFHSADWPKDLDVRGKKLAVVGSGATAMQVVPALVGEVESMAIYQKSAMWVAPSDQYFKPVPSNVHWLINKIPYYRDWFRFQLSWTWNDQIYPSLSYDPDWEHTDRSMNARNDKHRQYFTNYIESQLEGHPELVKQAVPNFPPFGKRMLVDNGWYEALKQPHVNLVDERLARVTENSAIGDDGTEYEADIIALCTGYDTSKFLSTFEVYGRNGRSLRDVWGDDDARAHRGITVTGFPNLFLIYGPNTNGAGGSFYSFAETQVRYILQLIEALATGELGAVEPKAEEMKRYNQHMDAELSKMVWSHPNVKSYYRNSRGRVTSNRPWSVVQYWSMLDEVDLSEFDQEPVFDQERVQAGQRA